MKRPPYIDELSTIVAAGPERTWNALRSQLRAQLTDPGAAPLLHVLGVSPAHTSGNWSGDLGGATLPGFAVADAAPNVRLELRGRHRFARYVLLFELDDAGSETTRLRARTYAEFPGLRGRVYRALVIGSGAHHVVTRRMLRSVAARAARKLNAT
jgi:hypothetical protein